MRCLPSLVLAGSILAASVAAAHAQGGTGPKSPQPPQAPSWVKVCETSGSFMVDLFGKPRPVGVRTCTVFSEVRDRNTGAVLVAGGVVQGAGQETLVIKVAAGVDRRLGARLALLPPDLWARVMRNEKVPELQGSPRVRRLSVSFSTCVADGCIGEVRASAQLLGDLKAGGGLVVVTTRTGRAVAQTLGLNGFRTAYEGPPIDTAKFYAARAELLRQIQARLKQGGGLAPMAPGGGGAGGTGPKGYGGPGPSGPGGTPGPGFTPKGPGDDGMGAPPPMPPVPPMPKTPRPGGGQDI